MQIKTSYFTNQSVKADSVRYRNSVSASLFTKPVLNTCPGLSRTPKKDQVEKAKNNLFYFNLITFQPFLVFNFNLI